VKAVARIHAELQWGQERARFDLDRPIDCAWPLHFADAPLSERTDENPAAFGLPAPFAEPIRFGDTALATKEGAPVNCHTLHLCPHGAGTHTECAAHISDNHIRVLNAVSGTPLVAVLLDVTPKRFAESADRHGGTRHPEDLVVDAAEISAKFATTWGTTDALPEATILRALDPQRTSPDNFSGQNPAYLTSEAIDALLAQGAHHLVTDLPSIDREQDGGTTPSHARFFSARPLGTVTEMARLGPAVLAGRYLMQLHLPPFMWESAPSRPILFPLQ